MIPDASVRMAMQLLKASLVRTAKPLSARALLLGAALLAGPAAFGASPSAPAPAAAVHLVQLLQLDTGAMLGVKAAVRDGARQGKVSPEALQCMERLAPGDLTEVLTGIVSGALSASEIAETDAFYSTPVGRKSVRIGVDQLRQKFGDTTVGQIPPFTPEDEAATRKFSETPAGKKILVDKVLQTAPAMGLLRDRSQALMAACRKNG